MHLGTTFRRGGRRHFKGVFFSLFHFQLDTAQIRHAVRRRKGNGVYQRRRAFFFVINFIGKSVAEYIDAHPSLELYRSVLGRLPACHRADAARAVEISSVIGAAPRIVRRPPPNAAVLQGTFYACPFHRPRVYRPLIIPLHGFGSGKVVLPVALLISIRVP